MEFLLAVIDGFCVRDDEYRMYDEQANEKNGRMSEENTLKSKIIHPVTYVVILLFTFLWIMKELNEQRNKKKFICLFMNRFLDRFKMESKAKCEGYRKIHPHKFHSYGPLWNGIENVSTLNGNLNKLLLFSFSISTTRNLSIPANQGIRWTYRMWSWYFGFWFFLHKYLCGSIEVFYWF